MDGPKIEADDAGPPPAFSDFLGVSVVEYFRRYGRKNVAGDPQGDITQTLAALAGTAGAVVAMLPGRDQRRMARAAFEMRFRRQIAALGSAKQADG